MNSVTWKVLFTVVHIAFSKCQRTIDRPIHFYGSTQTIIMGNITDDGGCWDREINHQSLDFKNEDTAKQFAKKAPPEVQIEGIFKQTNTEVK